MGAEMSLPPNSPEDYVTQAAQKTTEFHLSDRDFLRIAQLVKSEAGIVLGEHKRNLVYGRLARRLRALELDDFSDYIAQIECPDGKTELREMINAITTNLTSFFRESHHFETLADQVLPNLLTSRDTTRVRIWSAGCSSGEEPYSIAMTIAEARGVNPRADIKILATDIDTQMVAFGREGLYPEDRLRTIPPQLLSKHVARMDDGTAQMRSHLKSMITFKQLNLFDPWPMKGMFDVIFCRNVMIYFDKAAQADLFDAFARQLAPGGYLFIGHSETMPPGDRGLVHAGRTTYRRTG